MASISNITASDKQSATIETVLEDSRTIWAHVRKLKLEPSAREAIEKGTDAQAEEALNAIIRATSREFNNFATSFPLMLRSMVMESFYNEKLALKYFTWVAKDAQKNSLATKTSEDFLRRQSEYIVFVARHKNKRMSATDISRVRAESYAALKKESTEYAEKVRAMQNELDKHEKMKLKIKRDELRKFAQDFIKKDASDDVSVDLQTLA